MVLGELVLDTQLWNKECLLTVLMVTYNQEDYIAQALDSVLMQRTSFRFQILIGDDCSTDSTQSIIQTYANKFPDIIVPYLHEKNLGLKGKNNFMFVYSRCKTPYATILEGDDYWTDPHKLQTQVDFLERNKEFAMVHHRVQILKGGHLKEDFLNKTTPATTTILDLARGNYIRTLSNVFVNSMKGDLPAFYGENIAGDYILHMLNAQHGKIGYIDRPMGVYRIHDFGVWSNNSLVQTRTEWLTLLSNLEKYFLANNAVREQLVLQRCEILYSLSRTEGMEPENAKAYETEAERLIPGIINKLGKAEKNGDKAPSFWNRIVTGIKARIKNRS